MANMKSATNSQLPANIQRQVDRLRSQLNAGVFLSALTPPLLAILLCYAGLLVFAKMSGQDWASHTWIILILVLPAAVAVNAWLRHKNQFFSETDAVQWLDRLMKTDGWLATAYENRALADHPRFHSQLSQQTSALRWRYGFFLRRIAPAIIILGAAMLLPSRTNPPENQINPAVLLSSATDKLQETSSSLTKMERESFEERLQQLTRRTDKIDAESWEAISALEEDLDRVARRNKNQEKALANTASQINELANQAQNANSAEGANVIDQQLADLAEKLAKQAMEQASREGLTSSTRQTSGARIADLARQLRSQSSQNKTKSDKLREELKKECEGMCSGDGKTSGSSSGMSAGGEEEGQGSLAFRDIAEDPASKSTEKALENEFLAPEDFAPAGILRVEPKPDPGKFEPSTVREFDTVQGSRVARTRIRPSEQAVVQRYFEEE